MLVVPLGSASVSLANFNVGSWNTGAYMDGDIAELIIYNAKLSDHDRQRVEVYLARKWGLLPIMLVLFPVHRTLPKIHMFPQSVETQSPTSVPLVDNGGADANVTVFYGTVDAGLSSATSEVHGVPLHLRYIFGHLV